MLHIENYGKYLEEFKKLNENKAERKQIDDAFDKIDESIKEDLEQHEIIEKDRTLYNILDQIRSASTVEQAKEVFFENIIALLTCEDVDKFFTEVRIDEDGKRYTIGRDGRKYCFTSDLIGKILDEEFGEETTEHEEKTAWGVTFEEFQKIYEENNGFDVRYPKDNLPIVSESNNQNFAKANEIIISEPDMSILEGTMFHEVDDLNENQNIRTRKDNNK